MLICYSFEEILNPMRDILDFRISHNSRTKMISFDFNEVTSKIKCLSFAKTIIRDSIDHEKFVWKVSDDMAPQIIISPYFLTNAILSKNTVSISSHSDHLSKEDQHKSNFTI